MCLSNLYNYSCIKTWNLWKSTKTGKIQFWLWNILTYVMLCANTYLRFRLHNDFVYLVHWEWRQVVADIFSVPFPSLWSDRFYVLLISILQYRFNFINIHVLSVQFTASWQNQLMLVIYTLFWPVADVQLNNLYKL